MCIRVRPILYIDACLSHFEWIWGYRSLLHAHPDRRATTGNRNAPHDAGKPHLLPSSLRWRRRQKALLPPPSWWGAQKMG